MARPLRCGLGLLAAFAGLFEPVREFLSYFWLGAEVGGVGGVGGLVNLYGSPANCTTTHGGADAPYCFVPGVLLGLTPYALFVLVLITLPLAISAVLAARIPRAAREPEESSSSRMLKIWLALSTLWFALPLAMYASVPYYSNNGWGRLLVVSLAAAFPLSWHCSFIIIPSAGARFLAPLLGVTQASLLSVHRIIARLTVCWALLHGCSQLAYLASRGSLPASFDPRLRGENLLFVTGASTLALLTTLVLAVGISRGCKRMRAASRGAQWHSKVHRALAAAVLLSATAHWWPLALLLNPAMAVAAVAAAADAASRPRGAAGAGPVGGGALFAADAGVHCAPRHVHLAAAGLAEVAAPEHAAGPRACALALAAALPASVLGVALVFCARQQVMGRPDADTYSPFAFPPLAVAAGGGAARLAAGLALRHCERRQKLRPGLLVD